VSDAPPTATPPPVDCKVCGRKNLESFFEVKHVVRGQDDGTARVCSAICLFRGAQGYMLSTAARGAFAVKDVIDQARHFFKGGA
jgi:hypothetical protein